MASLVSLLGLIVFALVRPLELVPTWQGIPLLPMLVAASVGGLLLDASTGRIKPRATPHVRLAAAWTGWTLLTPLIAPEASLRAAAASVWLPFVLYLLVAFAVNRWEKVELVAAVVVACSIAIGLVCLHQRSQNLQCVALLNDADPNSAATADGRPCERPEDCNHDPPIADASYRCERAGLFGTTTVDGGRIRYVGVLHDPNEVALMVTLSTPLAGAIHRRRRCVRSFGLLLTSMVVASATVLASGSRGGMLVFAALPVIHAIFVGRPRIALVALAAVIPVLLLGGRTGERASASTLERIETWSEGLAMLRAHPLFGVGTNEFKHHHPLTAHNSFLLAASEQGTVGLVLWSAVLLAALDGLPATHAHASADPNAPLWNTALKTSLVGLALGSMFLSLNRHVVTWLYLGLGAAVWRCRSRDGFPFGLGFGVRDLTRSVAFGALVLVAIAAATRSTW